MPQQLDFIALGDITTDAFIKLRKEQAEVLSGGESGKRKLCMAFGDKLPYESVEVVRAVGNSPNAAVAAARLGLSSALISNIGDDENGRECVESLEKDGVSTTYIITHKNRLTNYHYVLWYEEERTILIKHEEYDYALPDFPAPKWLYMSSLAGNSLPYHEEIVRYLKKNPQTKLAFQPGTFQIQLGYEELSELYALSELFFCNKEEAQRILHAPQEKDMKNLLRGMHGHGPKVVVITDGPNGAYTFDGKELWYMPMYPDPKPPLSRTGAGDAFSSTFTSALCMGKTIPEALLFAPVNAMSVVQQIGAQKGLLTREQVEAYLAKAPTDYKATKVI